MADATAPLRRRVSLGARRLKPPGPFHRTMKHAKNVNRVTCHSIRNDVRESRDYQFPRSLYAPDSAEGWILGQH